MIAYVQSQDSIGNSHVSTPSPMVLTVGAGNTLIFSVGVTELFHSGTISAIPVISDNKGNIWNFVCSTPMVTGGGSQYQLFTLVALNCAAGSTTITISLPACSHYAAAVSEYSGIASTKAIGQSNYSSAPYGSGATSLSSGAIPVAATEMIYAVGYDTSIGDTFTASGGYTLRQAVNNGTNSASLAAFDNISSGGGSLSNTVTPSAPVAGALQTAILALSPTSITSPLAQITVGATSGLAVTSISTPFQYDNTAGNILIAVCTVHDRSIFTISDTNGNTWVLLYGATFVPVVAYSIKCKAGPNTVTVNSTGAGLDNGFGLMIAEYDVGTNPAYTNNSHGHGINSSTSVATGAIGVSDVPSLLLSCFASSSATFGALQTTNGTLRLQANINGYLGRPIALAISDETALMAGSYSETYAYTPAAGSDGYILGFSDSPEAQPLTVFIGT